MKVIRLAGVSIIFLAVASILFWASAAKSAVARTARIWIVLAGDSTVTPAAGWGNGFRACMDKDVQVTNLSRGGRSSKSYIKEGLWKQCLDLKPDYILIQFGHNDQPGHSADRLTDPQTTYKQYMNQYVDDARATGIKPILVTSMSRRQWGADGKIHSTLEPYVAVVKEIAKEKNVPLIDLHSRAIELYERIGKAGCEEISPLKPAMASEGTKPATTEESFADTKVTSPTSQPMVYDGTHLNVRGSALIGPIVAAELAKAVPELATHIKVTQSK